MIYLINRIMKDGRIMDEVVFDPKVNAKRDPRKELITPIVYESVDDARVSARAIAGCQKRFGFHGIVMIKENGFIKGQENY